MPKIVRGTDGQIIIAQTGADPKYAVLSGDVTMDKDGAITIGASKVGITELEANMDFTGSVLSKVSIPSGTPVNAVRAQGTLTVTGGGNQIANNDTVTLDVKTYTFKTVLTPSEGEVLIGANDTAALLNLKNALNLTGTPGTDYSCAAAHPTVSGLSSDATTLIARALVAGVAGNSIASTEVSAELSWDGTGTLGATVLGVDGTVGSAREMLADSSYFYYCTTANSLSGANWRRVSLGSAY
jgi:hypothetical protein